MQSVAVGSVRQLLSGVRSVWSEVQVPESHLAANVTLTVIINQLTPNTSNYSRKICGSSVSVFKMCLRL